MSCYGCSKKYGLFCKEFGCPNCGYSYCAKCLKRPIAVPRQGGKVLNVCLICFDKLTKLSATEKVIDCESLPGTLLTKSTIVTFDNGITTAGGNGGKGSNNEIEKILNIDDALSSNEATSANLGEVLAPTSIKPDTEKHSDKTENSEIDVNLDTVISKRLKDLKSMDKITGVTDDEIRARLSNLNGMPQKEYSKKDLLLSTDQRTEQEQMNDLLKQFLGETELDRRVESERNDAISDIERRLRALRNDPLDVDTGKKTTTNDTGTPSDNEDDESMLKKIMEKYLAEANLEKKDPPTLEAELADSIPKLPANMKPEDVEELPWCNICNEDAVYRCKGCEGELFCAQCFRECHNDDEEYRSHVKENYSAPPKFKEDHF